jgi:putative endonuclease
MTEIFAPCVYIMASVSGTLYTGVTSDLEKRIWEHKNDINEGFTKKYKCHKLVYFEHSDYMTEAIEREKEIKKWNRKKKENLNKTINPIWNDLAKEWH